MPFGIAREGWPGPIVAGDVIDIGDDLAAIVLADHAALFDLLDLLDREPPPAVHAAFDVPDQDKVVKSPRRKRSAE